jgi:hypothetical protein
MAASPPFFPSHPPLIANAPVVELVETRDILKYTRLTALQNCQKADQINFT